MEVTDQHSELVRCLREHIYPWRKFVIGIDGRDGAGKTVLARYLAWELNMSLIETDMLIIPDTDMPAYRYEDLGRLIEARHRLNRPLIIEGVFLLDTLNRINVECDYLVFVECKEFDGSGILQAKLESYEREYDPRSSTRFTFTWSMDR
jgi:uridine kinase